MCCPQCSGTNCYFTIYHTQAYKYSDAQELLQRIQCRDSGIELPPQTQLRLADPLLPAVPAGSADCSTGCRTKQGKPKQANVRCISHMCSDCCAAATQRAFDQNVERDACKTHRQGVVLAGPPPVAPVQLAPAIAPLPVQPVAAVLHIIPGSSSSCSHSGRAGYQIDSRWSDTVTYGAAVRRSGIVAKYSIIRIICPPQARK